MLNCCRFQLETTKRKITFFCLTMNLENVLIICWKNVYKIEGVDLGCFLLKQKKKSFCLLQLYFSIIIGSAVC